jgi:hypothetical protein
MKNLSILLGLALDAGIDIEKAITDKGAPAQAIADLMPLIGDASQLTSIDYSALKSEVTFVSDADLQALADIVKSKLPENHKLGEGLDLAIAVESLIKRVIAFVKG